MGNNSKHPVVERKRKKKKKGRPSLLDIQKRSLRLQEQQQQNPNPNPNSTPSPDSHLRHSGRRATRRNPEPDVASSSDDDGSGGRRREKKLKLVHRLSGDDADPDSDSKGEGNKAEKGTDSSQQEETLESGPNTALPDQKLLEFILDRLQKKDTYGVYSEPVDPEELPDYHDIIEHPMDFGTVRKKLDSGAYSNLEQFEKDVFLISTNAMKYNAPDTIYFRQARTINELSKKSFESLRDGTLGTEQEPKPAGRRGRPPNKNKKPENNNNINKKSNEKSSAPDFSFDTPKNNHNNNNNINNSVGRDYNNNSNDGGNNNNNNSNNQWSLTYDLTKRTALGGERTSSSEMLSWLNEQRVEKNEPSSGYGWRGPSAKYGSGKKPGGNGIVDETQRKTYKISQQLLLTSPDEFSILNTFDRDRKQLVPVGIQVEHVYARSLARYAAKLGPLGWSIAEEKIKRILPAGTKFGPGWVIDGEPVPKSKPEPDNSAKLDEKASNDDNTSKNNNDDGGNNSSINNNKDRNEEVQRTTSCVTSENNCSEEKMNNNNNQASKAMLINGFNTPVLNMGKIMVPHSQTFRPNNNIINNNNQRHGLNLAPDLNVGFQHLGSPNSNSNSNSNLKSGSKVESSSQQHQPDLALQL